MDVKDLLNNRVAYVENKRENVNNMKNNEIVELTAILAAQTNSSATEKLLLTKEQENAEEKVNFSFNPNVVQKRKKTIEIVKIRPSIRTTR